MILLECLLYMFFAVFIHHGFIFSVNIVLTTLKQHNQSYGIIIRLSPFAFIYFV